MKFPDSFIFGTATAAYQIEGDNRWSEWWYYEQNGKLPKSGKACNSWEKYEEDIELMARFGYQAYRFSIEWARIFPSEHKIMEESLSRYQEIIDFLNKFGIVPVITLHHFTHPLWFFLKGGFRKEENLKYWRKYVETIADNIKGVEYIATLNEPMELVIEGYLTGRWPPFIKDATAGFEVERNLINAHSIAYELLKPKFKVGLVKSVPLIRAKEKSEEAIKKTEEVDNLQTFYFLDAIFSGELKTPFGIKKVLPSNLDFIGVNYYTCHLIDISKNPVVSLYEYEYEGYGKTQMGWKIYPPGIYAVIKKVNKYRKPIFVTENGIATDNEDLRKEFIKEHLRYVLKALEERIDVRGYFYWSFLDNYEWDMGFAPKFGLFTFDPVTWERIPKKSAYFYSEIIRRREL